LSCALCALLLGALAWASPAAANAISAGDVQVGESASATFTITRVAAPVSPATTVVFHTVDGSAVSPADYVATSGKLSFGSSLLGATQTLHVTVAIGADALDEPNETFRLVLAGSEVTDADATATIVDDDPPPSLSIADSPAVAEGAPGAKASFVVRLSAPSGRAVSVGYATVDGSATAGQDYVARAGSLTLPAGSTQAALDVGVLDDGIDEPAETFDVRLSSPSFATLADSAGTATIVDDDEPPQQAPPVGDPAPAGTSGSSQPAGSTARPGAGASAPPSASSGARQTLGVSSPRLQRPATVLVTISCPPSAGRCSGRVTIFSVANKRSRVKALRKERKLGRATFSVPGGHAQTLALALGRRDLGLLRRTGRMRVRAYAITQDDAGRTGVRTVGGTLIARTAHSSSRRG
jgi:hypothetical protein